MRTIATTLELITKTLHETQDPRGEAEIFIAHVLGIDRTAVLAHPEKPMSAADIRRCLSMAKKRARGYALAILFGYKDFYGMKFLITKDTLVPRPESELLVELALNELHKRQDGTVLDVGTGSGNVIVAIAKSAAVDRFDFFASDVSRRALAVAAENARRKHVTIHFLRSNLLEKLGARRYDIIVANLPYLASDEMSEPSIRREPKKALWGGANGHELYQKFLSGISDVIEPGGVVFIEISPRIVTELKTYCENTLPQAKRIVHPDLAGRERVLELRFP